MNVFSTFVLTLRPVFTFASLKIVWFAYLVATIVDTITIMTGTLGLYDQPAQWIYLLPTLLRMLAHLVFVRLLLEVAIALVLKQG
jgi:hypothetical protein